MPHTHEFDCRLCGAHLDSQKQLDKHMSEQHSMTAAPRSTGDASGPDREPRRSSDDS